MDKIKLNQLKAGVCFLEVEIRNPVDIQDSGCYTGSGFIINHPHSVRRLVATCAHVAPFSTRSVSLEFNNGFRTKGLVVYTDHCHDLSFIEFEDEMNLVSHNPFEFEHNVSEFDVLTLIGGNEGYKSYVATGLVADSHILIDDRNTTGIQTSIPSAGGTSGSPVFNEVGKVVGMHIAATERCGFEMRIEIIQDALDRFIKEKPKYESGISFEYENKYKFLTADLITEADDKAYFEKNSKLLIIKDVDVFYDAFEHLMPGDVILKINHEQIHDAFLAEKVMNDSLSSVCEFLIKRNGVLMTKKIKLKNAHEENTVNIFQWENSTFQNTNITTRRYYSIKEEGVLLSKCLSGSPFSRVGVGSQKIYGGKGTLITHLNGIRVRNLSQFINVLKETQKLSVSFHYYDYISNVPQKFIICDVKYDQLKEVNFLNFLQIDVAA